MMQHFSPHVSMPDLVLYLPQMEGKNTRLIPSLTAALMAVAANYSFNGKAMDTKTINGLQDDHLRIMKMVWSWGWQTWLCTIPSFHLGFNFSVWFNSCTKHPFIGWCWVIYFLGWVGISLWTYYATFPLLDITFSLIYCSLRHSTLLTSQFGNPVSRVWSLPRTF